MTTTTDHPKSLLDLPLELRQHVYREIFGPPRIVDIRGILHVRELVEDYAYRPEPLNDNQTHEERILAWREAHPKHDRKIHESYHNAAKASIMRTSKTICAETLDFLYGHHEFTINVRQCSGDGYIGKIDIANLRRIRRFRILFDDRHLIPQPSTPDISSDTWKMLFTSLRQLTLMIEHPSQYHERVGHSLAQLASNWQPYIDDTLGSISNQVSQSTIILVDCDECPQTLALIGKYFPRRHRSVETSQGDLAFRRGRWDSSVGMFESWTTFG